METILPEKLDVDTRLVLGIGCDRGVSKQTLDEAIDKALNSLGARREQVMALASLDKKDDERALLAIAHSNNWTLRFFGASQLAKVPVPNPSEVVRKYMGTPAVAEAAAMLAANTGVENLLVEKLKYCGGDNKNATVSIVRVADGA